MDEGEEDVEEENPSKLLRMPLLFEIVFISS